MSDRRTNTRKIHTVSWQPNLGGRTHL